jgi:hypothetical protein
MLGTKLLYGEHSTKNTACNDQHGARFISYSMLRMREIGDGESKFDFLEETATERIFKLGNPVY